MTDFVRVICCNANEMVPTSQADDTEHTDWLLFGPASLWIETGHSPLCRHGSCASRYLQSIPVARYINLSLGTDGNSRPFHPAMGSAPCRPCPDFILACCGVEGNFLVVKADNYTDLFCVSSTVATQIPASQKDWFGSRLGMLTWSDMLMDENYSALSEGKGDPFVIFGATLYGFRNVTEEFFTRRSPLYEPIRPSASWAASALEHHDMKIALWNGATGGLLGGIYNW
ncbi:hypothetical protein BKA83DRAFT_4133348 [Pisolithus microcarpus]|nr:hypothetical protein BKA83DRAFT_4133348 [Pisolithus microcarpus]